MIEVINLSKHFGTNKAVDDISFSVVKGEILGFLGPNGAGKSTTMRMITGFIPPTRGSVRIGSEDVMDNPISTRKKIGYLPENAPVYPDMTVHAYLNFCAQIRGFSGSAKKSIIGETIEKCFLSKVRYQTISTLSKGYKQRVCFAQSILHDPEYLVLDEPTDGLDPNQKHEVRQMIRDMSTDKAIIFSTHILDEVDAICTRAIIISDGRLIVDESPDALRERSSFHGAVVLTVKSSDATGIVSMLDNIKGVGSTSIIDNESEQLKIRIFPDQPDISIADAVIAAANQQKLDVTSVYVEQGRLDEVFRKITTQANNQNQRGQ